MPSGSTVNPLPKSWGDRPMMLRLVFCRLLASVLLRAQAWQPAAYYIAFRGETVSSTALFERLVRAAPIVVDLALAVARPWRRRRLPGHLTDPRIPGPLSGLSLREPPDS
jgi:hypothetical protein